ncbi:hypothetical protein GPALN_006395 [Globodera pallida]|nr:hypothetical protein GPALN_006395 [Globodera pallida]
MAIAMAMARDEESVIVGSVEENEMMVANVPHRAHNVCGVLMGSFVITAPADDSLKRDLALYELFTAQDPYAKYFAVFARPEVSKEHACESFAAHLEVLKNAEGDVHLPTLTVAKPLKKLYFGLDYVQQGEHDADWKRPAMIVKLPGQCVFLVAMRTLSPTGNVETWLALAVGLGLVNALSPLHDKGFIHRYVTPWNFMVPMPFSMDNIVRRMVNMDLSLATRWSPELTYDAAVRFAGTVKYSSERALNRRTVGPADDMISVIFIVAELISGKLPWRAVSKIDKCAAMRAKFTETDEFRRLPREIRKLYGKLCDFSPSEKPEHVHEAFESALSRRAGGALWSLSAMPAWLEMPGE